MTLAPSPDLKPERATAPPKRWRNWYRGDGSMTYFCGICDAYITPKRGEIIAAHCRTFPSKDLAETFAINGFKGAPEDYLGAYPKGESP